MNRELGSGAVTQQKKKKKEIQGSPVQRDLKVGEGGGSFEQ